MYHLLKQLLHTLYFFIKFSLLFYPHFKMKYLLLISEGKPSKSEEEMAHRSTPLCSLPRTFLRFLLFFVINKLYTVLNQLLSFCIQSHFFITTQKYRFCNCSFSTLIFSSLIVILSAYKLIVTFFIWKKNFLMTLFLSTGTATYFPAL